jgi:hypothetical protein
VPLTEREKLELELLELEEAEAQSAPAPAAEAPQATASQPPTSALDLPAAPPPPESDPLNAIKYGLQSQALPLLGRGVLKVTDLLGATQSTQKFATDELGEIDYGNPNFSYQIAQGLEHIADEGYAPQTKLDHVLAFGTMVVDPVLGAAGKALSKVVSPAASMSSASQRASVANMLATKAAPEEAAKLVAATNAERMRAFMKLRAAEGAVTGGSISGGQEALRGAVEGDFDPARVALSTALGAGLGAAGGTLMGRLEARAAAKTDQAGALIREAFEQGPGGIQTPVTFKGGAAEANRALRLHHKISSAESKVEALEAKLASAKPGQIDVAATERSLETAVRHKNKLRKEFFDRWSKPLYEQMAKAKQIAGGGNFDDAFRLGVIPDEELIRHAGSVKDIPPGAAGAFGMRDPIRLLETVEGVNGPIARKTLSPILLAENAREKELSVVLREFEERAAKAGISRWGFLDRIVGGQKVQQSAKIFDAIEQGSLDALSVDEKNLALWMSSKYDDFLNRLNATRAAYNLPKIAKRKNYINHLGEMSLLQEFGIDVASAKLPELAGKRGRHLRAAFEYQRQGQVADKDIYKAFTTYANSAVRMIHMTPGRQQLLSAAAFMPTNLRAAVLNFADGSSFGGLEAVDRFFIENGAGAVPRVLGKFAELFGRSQIAGNLNIMVQQPSQVVSTIAMTDRRHAIQALGLAHKDIPEHLFNKSTFLPLRAARRDIYELGHRSSLPNALRHVDNVLDNANKFAEKALNASDQFVAKHSWIAAFRQAKARYALTDDAAVRYADRIAFALHSAYSDLYRPAILRSRVAKGLLPAQTFSFNMFNLLRHDTKFLGELKASGRGAELAKLVGSMIATNEIYKAAGLKAPFSLGTVAGEEGGEFSLPQVGPVGSVAGQPPIARVARDSSQAMGALYRMLFDEDADFDDELQKLGQHGGAVVANFVKYGRQISNVVKQTRALQEGYVSVGRRKEEVSLDSAQDKIQGFFLGPYNTPSAQEEQRSQRPDLIDRLLRDQ